MNVRPLLHLQVPAARLISRLDCLNELQHDGLGGTVGVFFCWCWSTGYGPGNSKSWGSGRETLGPMGPSTSPLLSMPFALWEGGAGLTRARLNPFGLPRDRPAGGPARQGKGGRHRTADEIHKGTQVVLAWPEAASLYGSVPTCMPTCQLLGPSKYCCVRQEQQRRDTVYCSGLARLIRLRACLVAYRPTQLGVPGYPKGGPQS